MSTVDRQRVALRPGSIAGEAAEPTIGRGERFAYLDNLKTLLIAGIIAAHAVQGYSEFGDWTYQDVQEVTLSPGVELISALVVYSLGAFFLMGLFLLVSGLLTQDSLERKGASRFVSDRLLRLGVPFGVYTLVVWPVLEYLLLEPYLHRGSYWRSFMDDEPYLDNGPMWFVGVLLIYSLALVAWRRRFPTPGRADGDLRARTLAWLALGVGLATFVLRLVVPATSYQPLNIHLWSWPEYVAMFALGVVAARRGWLRPVPSDLARKAGIATLIGVVLSVALVGSAEAFGLSEEDYYGGMHLPAFLGSFVIGAVVVAAPIWWLSFAQRHLNGTGPLRRAMARSSYLAFMLQGPVLVGLALALRPTDLSGDVKALLVAALGVVGSFALAWPVVTRTPLRRFL